MSPASYLTAPPRDAASSVALSTRPKQRRYHAPVVTAAWIALIFLVAALAISLTYLVVHGLRLWRTFRSVGRAAETAMAKVMRSADAAEEKASALSAKSERIDQARAHLQRSLAELAALRAAAAETTGAIGRIRRVVPRK